MYWKKRLLERIYPKLSLNDDPKYREKQFVKQYMNANTEEEYFQIFLKYEKDTILFLSRKIEAILHAKYEKEEQLRKQEPWRNFCCERIGETGIEGEESSECFALNCRSFLTAIIRFYHLGIATNSNCHCQEIWSAILSFPFISSSVIEIMIEKLGIENSQLVGCVKQNLHSFLENHKGNCPMLLLDYCEYWKEELIECANYIIPNLEGSKAVELAISLPSISCEIMQEAYRKVLLKDNCLIELEYLLEAMIDLEKNANMYFGFIRKTVETKLGEAIRYINRVELMECFIWYWTNYFQVSQETVDIVLRKLLEERIKNVQYKGVSWTWIAYFKVGYELIEQYKLYLLEKDERLLPDLVYIFGWDKEIQDYYASKGLED